MEIYQPAEDSLLLQKHIKQYAEGRVLDMGTGSGILAREAAKSPMVREVVAVDINGQAVEKLNAQKIKKITAIESDLFEKVSGKFNLIIFNPPYLPQDKGMKDEAIYGGKKGWEISERFFKQAAKYLVSNGKILFLFSSLTKKSKINEILSNHLFQYQELAKEKLHFEELYIYLVEKTSLLRRLEAKGIEKISYFDKGRRGLIYLGNFDRNQLIKSHFPSKPEIVKIAIKAANPKSKVKNKIENEINWLKILNQYNIGPKLLFADQDYMAYEFVEGKFLEDWLKTGSRKEIINIFSSLFHQCCQMDFLKVNKEEMHHPLKHIIIDRFFQPVLIDFERCKITDKPKNVTQLMEFICRLKKELENKGLKVETGYLRSLAKEYKKSFDKALVEKIIKSLSG